MKTIKYGLRKIKTGKKKNQKIPIVGFATEYKNNIIKKI
jgi:hypothetical protein